MPPDRPDSPEPGERLTHCAECGAALAHDQRYCLHCGERRGPLPGPVAGCVSAIADPDPIIVIPASDEDAAAAGPVGWLPRPTVAALAVMSFLSFGVVTGSLTTPGGVASLARTLVLSLPASAPPTSTVSASSGSGSGGGGGGSAPASTAASAPATTQTQQTVTVSASTTSTSSTTGSGGLLNLPPIKHVFVIMLDGQGYTQSFGAPSSDPYLAKTLRDQGELINDYYGVASSPLANEIALISGQGPTEDTAQDCPVYTDIAATGKGADNQVLGNGCVYPEATTTLPDELTDNGDTWGAYIQGIDQGPAGQPTSCRYPTAGQPDPNQTVQADDPYVTWRNPFVYFGSLTGNTTECQQDDVGLTQLAKALKKVYTTPNFTYIAPDPCDDGSEEPCTPGAPAGMGPADTFLKTVVPEIEKSPAYKADGLIVITFDQAPQSGPDADDSSCCDQPTFPNLTGQPSGTGTTTTGTTTSATTTSGSSTTTGTTTGTSTTGTSTTATTTAGTTTTGTTTTTGSTSGAPTTTTTTTSPTTSTSTSSTTTTGTTGTPPGGGMVGALLLSQYVKANSEDTEDEFNDFSLLKTIEDLFQIKHLGYSNDSSLPEFDPSVFNASSQ